MKIAVVIPTLETAGAEVMCKNLVLELKKRNIEVIVISLYDRKTTISAQLKANGIKVTFLDKKLGFDPRMILKLKSIFDKEKPNAVHTHLDCLKYSAIAAKLSGIKNCVHTVHNVAKKESGRIARIINTVAFKKLKVVPVALSEEIKESIVNTYHLQEKDVPIIYNGIDLKNCIPKTSYVWKEKITFVHVGRFSEQKNHKMLIEAFYDFIQEYEHAELLLVGKGNLLNDIKNLVEQYAISDKVLFLGERNDVLQILHDSDVFLLPSLYEGMPISIIEAMGTGLPIIATNVGGIPSMIQDKETGYLINCNKNELVSSMKNFTNEQIRKKCGKKALLFSHDNFSVSVMADKYYKVYGGSK